MEIDSVTYRAQAKSARQLFLVLHGTNVNFQTSIDKLTGDHVSAHYLVPTIQRIDPSYPSDTIIVYALVPETERAWHAGLSAWGNHTNLNDCSIGIEVVNTDTDTATTPYPEQQIGIVIELCHTILARYPDITPPHVLAHSDIAVGRKSDPGPLFPWKKLHEHGIGAWYDNKTVQRYKAQFEQALPSEKDVLAQLTAYGYCNSQQPVDLLKAFQMHFRPDNYSGHLDAETAAIAYALVDKYHRTI